MKFRNTLIGLSAILLLAISAIAIASEQKARIITSEGRTAQCISPIAINTIDDRLKNLSPLGFELEPGDHKLMGRAVVNLGNCPAVRGRQNTPIQPLEANFEAGKSYYVGVDHSSKNTEDWAVVIWKVE